MAVFAKPIYGRWRRSFRPTRPAVQLERLYCLYVYLRCAALFHSLSPCHGRQNFWLVMCTALSWDAVGLLSCISYYERSGILLGRSLLGSPFIGDSCSRLARLRNETVWLAQSLLLITNGLVLIVSEGRRFVSTTPYRIHSAVRCCLVENGQLFLLEGELLVLGTGVVGVRVILLHSFFVRVISLLLLPRLADFLISEPMIGI